MQRKNGKRGTRLTGMLAVLLAMGLAAAVAFPQSARAEVINLDNPCAITLTLPESYVDNDKVNDGLDITIDVYQIASAQLLTGYDAYTFKTTAAFTGLESALKDLVDTDKAAPTVDDFAQSAAKLVRDTEAIAPDAQAVFPTNASSVTIDKYLGKDGAEGENLNPGLYLVLARGTKYTDKADQFGPTEEDSEALQKSGQIVTVANSWKYHYAFKPMIVSLPTRDTVIEYPAEGGLGNLVFDKVDQDGNPVIALTSDPGNWVYEYSAELKPSRIIRRTSFRITKQLNTYESRQTTTFVFRINYTEPNGTEAGIPVSFVDSLVFTAAGRQYLEYDNIPVGTNVVVTEMYSGQNYVAVAHQGQTTNADGTVTDASLTEIRIPAEENVYNGVVFENDYDRHDKGGGSIKNEFTYVEGTEGTAGQWTLNRVYSQPQPAAAQ